MTFHQKLSLPAAILININIMLGAGIFLNTALLAHLTGALGGFAYLAVGVVVLPLVAVVARLVQMHPAGGFYIFASKELNPLWGFISAWGYFTGKLASSALTIHAAVSLFQKIIPALALINCFALDLIILALFIRLNLLNMRTGSGIQGLFLLLKIMSILFVILSGIYLLSGSNFAPHMFIPNGIPTIIPLVLYATVGFEATCSVSSRIENAEVNGPRAIFISYGLAIAIAFIFQTLLFGGVGSILATKEGFLDTYPTIVGQLLPNMPTLSSALIGILHIGLAISALGGAYGILYTNNWNLHTLASHNHLFNSALFQKFNAHDIPAACVIFEGIICAIYLLITHGNQMPLQQTSALGSICAYTLSVFSLLAALKRDPKNTILMEIVCYLALISCAILTTSCMRNFLHHGIESFYLFGTLIILGIFMFFFSARKPMRS